MTEEQLLKSIEQDLCTRVFLNEDQIVEVRRSLRLLARAAIEITDTEWKNNIHNKNKKFISRIRSIKTVDKYGKVLNIYPTIQEAADILHMNRRVIDKALKKHSYSRRYHCYFEYVHKNKQHGNIH